VGTTFSRWRPPNNRRHFVLWNKQRQRLLSQFNANFGDSLRSIRRTRTPLSVGICQKGYNLFRTPCRNLVYNSPPVDHIMSQFNPPFKSISYSHACVIQASLPCTLLFSWRYNQLWLYFHSPVAGFSLLVFEVSWSHTTTRHSRQDSSGQVINSSQRPLPDNTQHSQQTSMPPVGFEPTISAGERPKTYAFDRADTGPGLPCTYSY
jgi:hypothetical protein